MPVDGPPTHPEAACLNRCPACREALENAWKAIYALQEEVSRFRTGDPL